MGRRSGGHATASSTTISPTTEVSTLSTRSRSVLLLVGALATFPACSGGDGADGNDSASALAEAFAAEFVDAHNAARSRPEPTPDPAIPDVTWDDELALFAQNWTDACVFEHSKGETGENLAIDSRSVRPTDIVDYWYSEIADYDYADNTCARGAQCGHYTQVVWRDTERIGCAKTACSNVEGFGAGEFWACEYDPPGNFVGEKPY